MGSHGVSHRRRGPRVTAHPGETRGSDELWVPTGWDAQAVTSFERPVFRELQKLVRPGMTVYDIGANVGLFSVRLLRWIRPTGWLYAVEQARSACHFFARISGSPARRIFIFSLWRSQPPHGVRLQAELRQQSDRCDQ